MAQKPERQGHTAPEALLPIGSVVRVKEAEQDMMIVGVLTQRENVLYDYIGVLHPEGYLDQEHFYLFNQEDLEKVEFIGYINAAVQLFHSELKNLDQKADQEEFQ